MFTALATVGGPFALAAVSLGFAHAELRREPTRRVWVIVYFAFAALTLLLGGEGVSCTLSGQNTTNTCGFFLVGVGS